MVGNLYIYAFCFYVVCVFLFLFLFRASVATNEPVKHPTPERPCKRMLLILHGGF